MCKNFKNYLNTFKALYSTNNILDKDEIVLVIKCKDFKFKLTRSGKVKALNRQYAKEGKTKTIYNQSVTFSLDCVHFDELNDAYMEWDFVKTLTMYAYDLISSNIDSHQPKIGLDENYMGTVVSPEEIIVSENYVSYLISTLSHKQREAFLMNCFEHMSRERISELLAISPSSVRDRITGAKALLLKYVER